MRFLGVPFGKKKQEIDYTSRPRPACKPGEEYPQEDLLENSEHDPTNVTTEVDGWTRFPILGPRPDRFQNQNAGFLYREVDGERWIRPSPELVAFASALLKQVPGILAHLKRELNEGGISYQDLDTATSFRKTCNRLGITDAILNAYSGQLNSGLDALGMVLGRQALNRLIYPNIHAEIKEWGFDEAFTYYKDLLQRQKDMEDEEARRRDENRAKRLS